MSTLRQGPVLDRGPGQAGRCFPADARPLPGYKADNTMAFDTELAAPPIVAGEPGGETSRSPLPAAPAEDGSAFPETRWTRVIAAAAGETTDHGESLRFLAGLYRPAICEWFRRAGLPPADAEDLTHDFLLEMLGGRLLRTFNRRDTRFRVFLQVCLRNFLRDSVRRRQARKRGGGSLPLELEDSLAAEGPPAVTRLEEEMARLVHELAVNRVAADWQARGASERFVALRGFMFNTPAPGDYAAVAERLGVRAGVVKKAVFDLRKAYYQAIREHVARTVAPEALAEELRHLVEILARML